MTPAHVQRTTEPPSTGGSKRAPEDLVRRWRRSSLAPVVTPARLTRLLAGGEAVVGRVSRGRWAVTVGDVTAPPTRSGP